VVGSYDSAASVGVYSGVVQPKSSNTYELVAEQKATNFGAPSTGFSSNYFDMPMPMDQVRAEV
jgi:hypothetical protein